MAHDFNAISFALRTQLRALGHQVSLGHSHQLLAAALGYNTMASMQQALQGRPALALAEIVVLDLPRLTARCVGLNLSGSAAAIIHTAVATLINQPTPPLVFKDWDEFLDDYLVPTVSQECLDDEHVASVMAETNAGYYDEAEIEVIGHTRGTCSTSDLPPPITVSPCGQFLEIPFGGTLIGEQDEERAYSGNVLDLDGTARVERVDVRCLLKHVQLDIGAQVERFDH